MRTHAHSVTWPETVWYDYTDPETGIRQRLAREAGERTWQCTGPLTQAKCDAAYGDWLDDRLVALAARADVRYHKDRKPDADQFTQTVQVLNGTRPDILNKEGNPNQSAAAKRLRRAIERYRASNPDK